MKLMKAGAKRQRGMSHGIGTAPTLTSSAFLPGDEVAGEAAFKVARSMVAGGWVCEKIWGLGMMVRSNLRGQYV